MDRDARFADEAETGSLPVDPTLRRVALVFRLLGWAWMMTSGVLTIVSDEGASAVVVSSALAIVTVWTIVTVWAARSHERIGRSWFVCADGLVAMAALAASSLAGADDFFHGGYPMSWLGVAAYAWGLRGALGGSIVLAVEQGIVEVLAGKPLVPIAGSITFVVFAVVAGWGFSTLRAADRARLATERRLTEETNRRIRLAERAALADRLHDSVLQTLVALRREADDSDEVRYLARRQERELRQTIDSYRSPYDRSLRAAVLAACAEVEDLHRVDVESVMSGDAELVKEFEGIPAAVREAVVNAAKHSGAGTIAVTGDLGEDKVSIYVMDRGVGFDPDRVSSGGGLDRSLRRRVEAAGGTVDVVSQPGEGTEVVIQIARAP